MIVPTAQVYVYNTYHRKRDYLWTSRCPLCEVQFLKPTLLESFNTFADHIKEQHPIAVEKTQAHATSLPCYHCGFSFSAHADGYCPDCNRGTKYMPVKVLNG